MSLGNLQAVGKMSVFHDSVVVLSELWHMLLFTLNRVHMFMQPIVRVSIAHRSMGMSTQRIQHHQQTWHLLTEALSEGTQHFGYEWCVR